MRCDLSGLSARFLLCASLALPMLHCGPVSAENVVKFNGVGQVTGYVGDNVFGCMPMPGLPCGGPVLLPGDRFLFTYTYDADTVPLILSTGTGSSAVYNYQFAASPNEINVFINAGYSTTSYQTWVINDEVTVVAPDQFSLLAGVSRPNATVHNPFLIDLESSSTAALDSSALPAVDLNLSAFDLINDGRFTIFTDQQTTDMLRFTVEQLTVAGAPIPEPGTLALLALGLPGLGFSRRRKQ